MSYDVKMGVRAHDQFTMGQVALALSLATYVMPEDVFLDRPIFLRHVADRMTADLANGGAHDRP